MLEHPSDEDIPTLHGLIYNHKKYTNSSVAGRILDNFADEVNRFVKVMPLEYRRILESRKAEEKLGLVEVSDG